MCSRPKVPTAEEMAAANPPATRYQGGHAPTYSETGSKTGRSSTILTGGNGVRTRSPAADVPGTMNGKSDAATSPTVAMVKKTLLGV